MALVKCPECGRENVSNSAESCPSCGYGIKAHYEAIKAEKDRKEQQERIKKQQEEIKKQEEKRLEERLQQVQQEINDIPEPSWPIGWLFAMIYGVSIGILWLIIGETIIGKGVGLFLIAVTGIGGYANFKDKLEVYKLSKTDMQGAKRLAYSQQKQQEAFQAAQAAQRNANKLASMFKCPNCGKQAGKPIGVVSKSVSVGTMGLASNKIGKSYKCSSCGYMW